MYEGTLRYVCEKYGLTQTEADVISFLHNNPGLDTAADIVELRGLSKGNVSQSVESLIQKSLLRRSQDTRDRLRIHLSILPEAAPITAEIERFRTMFKEQLLAGFTDEERRQYSQMNARVLKNSAAMTEKGELK